MPAHTWRRQLLVDEMFPAGHFAEDTIHHATVCRTGLDMIFTYYFLLRAHEGVRRHTHMHRYARIRIRADTHT